MESIDLDTVAICIDGKLGDLTSLSSDRCIFKVPNDVIRVNEKAYEPVLVAIGPYHSGKDHLKAMEEHKLQYLQSFLKRINENSVSKFVDTIRKLEGRARSCYAEAISLTEDKFAEMMVVDGCFFIEFLVKHQKKFWKDDPIFLSEHIKQRVELDLLLVENQLPFFLVLELFRTAFPNKEIMAFIKAILAVFKFFLPGPGYSPDKKYSLEEMMQIEHVLALIHANWQPPPEKMEASLKMKAQLSKTNFMRCATELKEVGIKFEKVEGHNLFDINFRNGVLEIPKLKFADSTECVLRNLIAYEQLNYRKIELKYVSEYQVFMDSLINSAKDVELLCGRGIIENWLGDDEAVATLLNNLGIHVICNRTLYRETENNINKHCRKRWNMWMAKLRHDYFNTPWALISVLAAIMLLGLAWTQTVYSVLAYYK